MYGIGLVCVLAGLASEAAGTRALDAPPCLIDAHEDDVRAMLGRPSAVSVIATGAFYRTTYVYFSADWLGGRRVLFIDFDENRLATRSEARRHPFAETPSWLDALRDAFAPRPAP